MQEQEDPYNGTRKTYREDGTLMAAVSYKDSIRDGVARNYFRNGVIQLEMTYVKGLRHGNAISYYENGNVYQVTPYVDGKRQGIQRKYYEGHVLMAEIPFEDNRQVKGIKEYSKSGNMITREAKIVFSLVDKTAFEDSFELNIQLSDGSRNVKFSRYFPDSNSEVELNYPISTIDGKATLTFIVPPGRSWMERIYIEGERKTRLGNMEVFKASYNLAVENTKRFY